MTMELRTAYRFNTLTIKMTISSQNWLKTPKFQVEQDKPMNPTQLLAKWKIFGWMILEASKQITRVVKTTWHRHLNRHVEQQNKIEDPNMCTHKYSHLQYMLKKNRVYLINGAGKRGCLPAEE